MTSERRQAILRSSPSQSIQVKNLKRQVIPSQSEALTAECTFTGLMMRQRGLTDLENEASMVIVFLYLDITVWITACLQ